MAFRFYLVGLSPESRFKQAIGDDVPEASEAQLRGLADV